MILKPPPAMEYPASGIANTQRTPGIWITRWVPVVDRANGHAPGIKPKANSQCFEGTFLCTPEQSQQERTLSLGRSRNEIFFVVGEVVSDEGIAPGLNCFQVAAEADFRWRKSA